tara:strand:- start:2007 stop:2750 length:744 start_codon:yes stop_codon:yes gene_type:complete
MKELDNVIYMDEAKPDFSNIIFITGAPGSKWSAVSWVLSESPFLYVSKSDRTPERLMVHDAIYGGVRHTGVYFGPGNELGKKFDKINTLSKREIYKEIKSAWAEWDQDKTYIVRCHQFIYNWDWMIENFPEARFVTVTRPPESCVVGWTSVGGIDTPYPHYKEFYKTQENAIKQIKLESKLAHKAFHEHRMDVHIASHGHFYQDFMLDGADDKALDRYIKHLEGYQWGSEEPLMHLKHDVLVGYLNF